MDQSVIKSLFDRCDKEVGVTPHELYMRQNGLCWLVLAGTTAACTDGVDLAPLASMLNPTMECAVCAARFIERLVAPDEDDKAEQND